MFYQRLREVSQRLVRDNVSSKVSKMKKDEDAEKREPERERGQIKATYFPYKDDLEADVARQLRSISVNYRHERFRIHVRPYGTSGIRHYTPTFIVPNWIIIEPRKRFSTEERQMFIYFQREFPELEVRFIFANSKSKISRASKITYAMWCDRYGFKYGDKRIPAEWFGRKPRTAQKQKRKSDASEASSDSDNKSLTYSPEKAGQTYFWQKKWYER